MEVIKRAEMVKSIKSATDPKEFQDIWEQIPQLPTEMRNLTEVLSAMPTTQTSVERLFS